MAEPNNPLLTRAPDSATPEQAVADRVEPLLADQEARWRRGERVLVEAYLQEQPTIGSRPQAILDLLYHEIVLREARGETPALPEYVQRFPHLAQELEAQFDFDRAFQGGSGVERTVAARTSAPAGAAHSADLPAQVGRYRVEQEIARGGMGRIVRVRDEDFDRPLALKVLLNRGSELEERFLREARMTGLLQHPGIPPVHALGRLEDGRPYFVMKLIQGRSLEELLKEQFSREPRASVATDLPRLVGIFEHICQTVGYAHARGVIHRDLKPANVMVGAFGEVQVMDWGLAKFQGTDGPEETDTAESQGTVFSLGRTVVAVEETAAGTVFGTPAYMAPEQARGEVESLDARADVFGLGAILCEMLTGRAPFSGSWALKKAKGAELNEALERLAGCGADTELVDLARRCLAPRKEDRPADGSAVAEAVATYQAELDRRLRQAEIDRAAANARAEEEKKLRVVEQARADEEHKRREAERAKARAERKRRRLALALTVTLVLVTAGAGAVGLWFQADQARQETALALRGEYLNEEVRAALKEAAQKRADLNQKLRDPRQAHELLSDIDQWRTRLQEARATWRRARALAEGGRELLDGHLAGQLADLGEVLAADEKDWALAKDLDDLRIETVTPVKGRMELHRAAEKYPLVFVKGGLDVWDGELSDVANRVVRSPIRYALVAALDDWASRTSDPKLLPRLLAVARKADPDPWRDRFRDEKVSNDPKELQGLIKDLRPEQQSPQVMLALALRLGGEEHARLLRRALPHHTRDFWLYFQLGSVSNDPLEKIACNQAAVAVRPRSALAHFNLGDALLRKRRDLEAAIIQLRTAIQLNPDFAAAYNHLGLALLNKKDLDGAIAQYRKAIQLDPSFPLAHANLRVALFAKTALEEVVTPLRKASKQKPTKP